MAFLTWMPYAGKRLDCKQPSTLPGKPRIKLFLSRYPPVPYVNRTYVSSSLNAILTADKRSSTRQDVVLPLGTPITGVDGTEISKITIPRNTGIIVSIIAVNRDPGIWGPDVMEWKPERWLSTLPASVTDARIPGIYSNTYVFTCLSPSR